MTARPLTGFNFRIDLRLGDAAEPLCGGSFSEVDGLEIKIEPKTIREGGGNGRQIHLMGPVGYGELTLRRGMSETLELWDWFERVQSERGLRAEGEITVLSPDRERTTMRYQLGGCFPLSLKGPALNAGAGEGAIEEAKIAYETLRRAPPEG
jgi:phage tail-like protein